MKANPAHAALLTWYEGARRDLPWRRTQDPYRIWLSEIMLQQTRVEAVLPYYTRFLSTFPTVHDLASADLDRVTNLWAGLGYYSRARNLHAAAMQVVEQFRGKFPSTAAELRTLKGIGDYTASAIASIAFGELRCALDGNLERVFSRLLAFRGDPKSRAGRGALLEFGESLVALGHPGEVNQAVMDLANAICVPKNPRCLACPLQAHCEAKRLGLQDELPVRRARPEKVLLDARAWAVLLDQEILLARRAKGSWLAGMWDLPWRVEKDGTKCAPPSFGEARGTCTVGRTITKHKIAFEVRGLRCQARPNARALASLCAEADEFRWVPLEDLHGLHLPRPSERALEKLLPELD